MMTVRASVRGHEGLFMFETGGGISYISPSFAQTVSCKAWGQISGFTLTGQRLDMPRCDGPAFDVQGRTLNAPIAGVFDIMQVHATELRNLSLPISVWLAVFP
jgi:hypothetical protein